MARNFSNDDLNAGNVLNITGNQITLSIWVRFDTLGGEQKFLARWQDSGGQFSYLLTKNGSNNVLFVINTGSNQVITGSTTVATGTWYHIVGTYDGSIMRLYLNGVEDGTHSTSGNINSSTAPLRIGSGSGSGENPLDGDAGHGAIWDVGLTANQAIALASGISPLNIRRDDLLFYVPINGQSPEKDVVGGFDMTVSGTVVVEEPPIPHSIVAP